VNEQALQHKLERWCLASMRALAHQPALDYRGHQLLLDKRPLGLRAPYLHLNFSTRKTNELRGVADSVALRLTHSDLAWHRQNTPDEPIAALIFDIAEQLRCESLIPPSLPGLRSNIRQRFLFWANHGAASQLVDNDIGLLLFTINVVCWSRLHGQAIPESLEELIEGTRWGFSNDVKHHLYQLKKHLHNQQDFAQHAIGLGIAASEMIQDQHGEQNKSSSSLKVLEATKNLSMDWLSENEQALQNHYGEAHYGVLTGDDLSSYDARNTYTVFTKQYDIEVNIIDAIRPAQLSKLRTRLDAIQEQQAVNVHRLARHIEQRFSTPKLAGWSFGHDTGYLDAARLSRLLSRPSEQRLFKQEDTKPSATGTVTILIDNSGSMTRVQEPIVALVDTLVKALELVNFKTEVLGFTTVDWTGGKALQDWQRAGQPKNPGRLNGVRHTVYKAANQPWRRARPAIAGLLRSDLFREGVDGEAIEWAASRLRRRSQENKILMVISDGSPMETATHKYNNKDYLDQHLRAVARQLEDTPVIKLCALGVGLDLSSYYQRSAFVNLENRLTTKDMIAVANLLTDAC